jgi:transketolase
MFECDGHDLAALVANMQAMRANEDRPSILIAHTVKGKGVSYMEGHYFWHTRAIKPEELAQAMAELGEPVPAGAGESR